MTLKYIATIISIFSVSCIFCKVQAQASSGQNYVMTNTVKQAGITSEGQIPGLSIPAQGKSQTIAYFDGLGRPLQTVATQASFTLKDIVAGTEYDQFGREVNKYLPFADINNAANPGSYKASWKTSQLSFYNGQLQGVDVDVHPYSQTNFEPSPLNRMTKEMAAGSNWSGNGVGVGMSYMINTPQDAVRVWNITSNTLNYTNDDATNIPTSSLTYDAGQLYKNVTTDENNHVVVEYKDKQGLAIAKKVQVDGTIAADYSGYTGFLYTYYVYDDLNLLRFVIPPKAVVQLAANSWTLATGVVNELCFRYEYDERNRMIAKKVPGAGWVYMVYDKRDRLVFTQDANMRIRSQWLATLYDALNRPVTTGMINYSGTRDALQTYVSQNTGSSISSTVNANLPALANLTIGQREPGKTTYQASNSIEFVDGFNSEPGAGFIASIGGTPSSETLTVIDNPLPPGNNLIVLTISYYDDYNWTTSTYNSSLASKLTAGSNPNAESMPAAIATKGMVTGTKTRVIEDPADLTKGIFLSNSIFYDDRGRTIQSQSDNYKGGQDVTTNMYDFSGKVLSSYLLHNNLAAANGKRGVLTSMQYDAAGRVLTTTKSIYDNDGATATTTKVIANNDYNELGQLKTKSLEPAYGANGLEQQDYEYNIRGWLLGINRGYARDVDESDYHHFGFDLGYEKQNNNLIGGQTYAAAQFNGNITGMVWKSKGDREKRKYDFTYDAANRLMGADFNQYTSGSFNRTANIDFSVKMGNGITPLTAYDANGNITSMKQWGLVLNTSAVIDDLSYTYLANSNKLASITEASTVDAKLGDYKHSDAQTAQFASQPNFANDYYYDDNGNMVKDKQKGIYWYNGDHSTGGIIYNHLNLPYRVPQTHDLNGINNTGWITYIYDAAGNKLEKKVEDVFVSAGSPTKITVTDYVSGSVYQDNQLQFFGQEEGRIRYKAATNTAPVSFVFDYFLKDHLGNVRSVLTDEQQKDMYPAATMETAQATDENRYYSKIEETRSDKPSGYPADGSTSPNDKAAKVNGSGNKIGPGITLKVMAGDKFNLHVSSWWKDNGHTQDVPIATPLKDLLSTFLTGSIGGIAGSHGTASQLQDNNVLSPAINDFLNGQPAQGSTKPKAYVNWILFDEQFKIARDANGSIMASGYSGADQVGSSDQFKPHNFDNIPISKNGYLYIYVSNETPNIDVFFDNLQVTHTRGALLEETHYYPFGLTMAGISAKSAGGIENKFKFNSGNELQSEEFNDGSGLELYDAIYRMYDPQIGRFMQIDPLADFFGDFSPYGFAGNNPILVNDPLGLAGSKPAAGDPNNQVEVIVTAKKKKCQTCINVGRPPSTGSLTVKNNKPVDTKTAASPINYLHWPTNSQEERIQWQYDQKLYFDRIGSGKPVIQGGESEHYLNSLSLYKNWEIANQESKVLQGTFVAGVLGPLAGAALADAELGNLLYESQLQLYRNASRFVNATYKDFTYALINILRNRLSVDQIIRLERFAEKYKDINKIYKNAKQYKDYIDKVREVLKSF